MEVNVKSSLPVFSLTFETQILTMKIQFSGAARTVTGSKHLLVLDNGIKIMLDCGMYQGLAAKGEELNRAFDFNPWEIDYLILSHAHIDHSGLLPYWVKNGFKGKIICSHATKDLCKIMLADTAHIQENDLRFVNKRRLNRGEKPLHPMYDSTDVIDTLLLMEGVSYHTPYQVCEGVMLHFTFIGHILGSACVNLSINEKDKITRFCFTGDIGRTNGQLLKNPEAFPQADYIITESTYGDRLHQDIKDTEEKLLSVVINTCVKKKGKLIIPAFSLGRTQEMVYALDKMENKGLLPRINVYVDSPLSVSATNIMRKHTECYNEELLEYIKTDADPFGFNRLIYIQDVSISKSLNNLDEPCIIISASGMMEAGRIKHHLANNVSNPKNTVLVVGYCEPNSLGARIRNKDKFVRIYSEEYPLNADVEIMDSYSAHGDYNEMIGYLSCQDKSQVKEIFLVHGEYSTQQAYRDRLINEGFAKVSIPERGDVVELSI